MALQVWLPLNGDINNQGCSDLTFSNISASYTYANSNGKLGRCFYNANNSNGGLVSNKTISLGNKQSMCCWMKFVSLESSSNLGGSMGGQHRYPSCTGMGLTLKYVSSTTGYLSINTGTGSGRTYNTYCGSTLLYANIWYHVAFTYDGNIVKLYVNGQLDGTHTIGTMLVPADYIHVFCWSFAGTSGNALYGDYKFYGYMNDFRVYDNCLSSKEIKEISKGLVLHYSLSDPYIETTVNLWNQKYEWHLPAESTGDAINYSISVSDANSFTLSSKQRFYSDDGTVSPRLGLQLQYTDSTTSWFANYNIIRDGNWYTYSITGTKTSGKTVNKLYGWVLDHSNVSGSKHVDVEWIQIEAKDHMTPFVAGTRYQQLNYDSSGNRYNGTVTGTIVLASDTPRNSQCYLMSNTSTYIKLPTLTYSNFGNSYTFAWWSKIADMGGKMAWGFSDGNRLNVYPSTYFCWNTGDGGSNPFKNSSGTGISYSGYNGAWHHYAVTGNGSITTLYIDGTAVGTATTYKALTGTQIYISGWDTGSDYKWSGGWLSDFRIYSTCLDAASVRELYNTPVSITNNGALLTQGEIIEE